MVKILKALFLGGTVRFAKKEAKKAQKLAKRSMKRAKRAVFFTAAYFVLGAAAGAVAVYKLKK
jgi:hypothetical protein